MSNFVAATLHNGKLVRVNLDLVMDYCQVEFEYNEKAIDGTVFYFMGGDNTFELNVVESPFEIDAVAKPKYPENAK